MSHVMMPEYQVWKAMRQRCKNPHNKDYHHYGGRGISVCERWESFHNFIADMGSRPDGFSLDRIDNDGDYRATNCRWANQYEQVNNSRHNHFLEYRGKRLTLSQWASFLDLPASTVRCRVRAKLPIQMILSKSYIPRDLTREHGSDGRFLPRNYQKAVNAIETKRRGLAK